MLRDDILNQLSRVLDANPLANSAVLTDFLTFVVTETLDGRGESLKEYTIGVQALKKEQDFNPQVDSIVRIHAGRLRRALKEYYYESGKDDAIIISIPKGSYAASFKAKEEEVPFALSVDMPMPRSENVLTIETSTSKKTIAIHHAEAPVIRLQSRISICVAPFKNIGSEVEVHFFASGLGQYMSTELTHFQSVKVVGYTPLVKEDRRSLTEADKAFSGADFMLSGSVQWRGGRVRIWVQFNRVEGKEQLWAQTFEKIIPFENYWEFQDEVVDQVLASLMGLNGVIARYQVEKADALPEDSRVYPIHYWFYHHIRNYDVETSHKAIRFYEEILKKDPQNALAHAYLSQIQSDQVFIQPERSEKPMAEGLVSAHKSIKCDPHCQEGYLALAFNLLLRKDYDESIHALEQGLAVNPKSIEFRGAMGASLIGMGHYERGKGILDSAFTVTPHLPWWQILTFSFYHFHREDYQSAITWVERIEMGSEQVVLLRAASYAYKEELGKALETLQTLTPRLPLEDCLSLERLKNLFTPPALAQQVQYGLRKLMQYKAVGTVAVQVFTIVLLA